MSSDQSNPYADIIRLPRPISARHQPMSLYNRAAQFAPFAALNGHEDAIDETARLTEKQPDLDDRVKEQINRTLQMLCDQTNALAQLEIFIPDNKKAGGMIIKRIVEPKKLDEYTGELVLTNKERIPLENIISVSETEDL